MTEQTNQEGASAELMKPPETPAPPNPAMVEALKRAAANLEREAGLKAQPMIPPAPPPPPDRPTVAGDVPKNPIELLQAIHAQNVELLDVARWMKKRFG